MRIQSMPPVQYRQVLGLYLKRPPRNSRQSHDPWPGASDTALRLLARVAESPSWRRNSRLVRYPRAEQVVTQYAVAKSNMPGVSTLRRIPLSGSIVARTAVPLMV